MTWGFPVTVVLVPVACGNFGRAFWARLECRCRPRRSGRAARRGRRRLLRRRTASSDEVAVTWVDSMERSMWRRAAAEDSHRR